MRYLPAVLALLLPLSAHAEGSAEKGAIVFKKCSACHDAEQPRNKIGPTLVGIVGRKAGSIADFKYSDAMTKAGADGVVWDTKTIGDYLAAPRKFIPGNKMSFTGLKNPQDVEDLIAYLGRS